MNEDKTLSTEEALVILKEEDNEQVDEANTESKED